MQKAFNLGFIQHVGSLPSGPFFNCLQFADDTLILFPDDSRSIRNIKILLFLFQLTSGLNINFSKSSIYGMGNISNDSIAAAAQSFRCSIGSFPFTYLGIPIKPGRLTKDEWLPLFSRMEKRLESWKGGLLSRGGRLILVNAVLTSMPLHLMSYFLLPKWVTLHIDRIRRSFFWKGKHHAAGGVCLISWDICCRPRNFGGLGVINLRLFNISLVSKWWWKLMSNPSTPWAKLILHSYYPTIHHLQAIHHSAPHTSPFWKGVIKTASYFMLGLRYILGDGTHIHFWTDP